MMKKFAIKSILFLVAVLIVIGLLMVFSASSSFALFRTKSSDFMSFFNHQMFAVAAAAVAFIGGLFIPYDFYRRFSRLGMFISLALLIAVLFFDPKKGASRWIELGGFSFQPTDLVKLVLIFHLSNISVRYGEKMRNFKRLLIPLGWTGIVMFLIALQPNFSNVLIVGILGGVMIYIGGGKARHILPVALAGVAIVFVIMISDSSSYRYKRITNWVYGTQESASPSEQAREALVGLGNGGKTGVGLGKSQQADLFLPEAYGDFIFAILGEELGFAGTFAVSTIYLVFFLMSLIMLNQIEDQFGKLIVFGLSFNIVLNAMINILVVLGITPTTGITLPFISYGGSSLVVFVFSVGVMLNVVVGKDLSAKLKEMRNGAIKLINKIANLLEGEANG